MVLVLLCLMDLIVNEYLVCDRCCLRIDSVKSLVICDLCGLYFCDDFCFGLHLVEGLPERFCCEFDLWGS